MFKNSLIAVNWSGTSVDAATLAQTLSGPDGRLTLVHVHAEVPMSSDPIVMHLRRFELRHSTRALKGASFATGIEPTMSVSAPSVGEGIDGLISMVGADLLVLGPVDGAETASGELVDWLRREAGHGSSAIALARPGSSATPLRRIGAVRDGSRAGEAAVAAAAQLAESLRCRLRVHELAAAPEPWGPRQRAAALRRLERFAERVDLMVSGAAERDAGLSAHTAVLLTPARATRRTPV